MRLSKQQRETRPDVNMTPMIDIVFLLIIFFMTVSQVSEVNKERLDLPKQPGSADQKPATVTINVDQAGDIIVSGRTVSVPQLVDLLGRELQRVGNRTELITVVLRGDQRGTSTTFNEIARALDSLDIKRVNWAVEAPN